MLKKIWEWIKDCFCLCSVVRRALKRYYNELADMEEKETIELCLYGEKIKETFGYRSRELHINILKFKIAFWESFI